MEPLHISPMGCSKRGASLPAVEKNGLSLKQLLGKPLCFRAGTKYLQEQTVWSCLLYHIPLPSFGKIVKPILVHRGALDFFLHWNLPSELRHTDLLCLTKWAYAMRSDVILFPSRLSSAEKDSNLHSQTLAAVPADGATWSTAHFARVCLGSHPASSKLLRERRLWEGEG